MRYPDNIILVLSSPADNHLISQQGCTVMGRAAHKPCVFILEKVTASLHAPLFGKQIRANGKIYDIFQEIQILGPSNSPEPRGIESMNLSPAFNDSRNSS
jgi:hypothetical protein